MKMKIYIETSVISYLTARPSNNVSQASRQKYTREFWDKRADFEVYMSELVVQEASAGNEQAAAARLVLLNNLKDIALDESARNLARKIIEGRAIPESCPEDALHVAIAAVSGMDVLLTWNFKHLNNPFTRMMVRQTVENAGYRCPELCSPEELLGDD